MSTLLFRAILFSRSDGARPHPRASFSGVEALEGSEGRAAELQESALELDEAAPRGRRARTQENDPRAIETNKRARLDDGGAYYSTARPSVSRSPSPRRGTAETDNFQARIVGLFTVMLRSLEKDIPLPLRSEPARSFSQDTASF